MQTNELHLKMSCAKYHVPGQRAIFLEAENYNCISMNDEMLDDDTDNKKETVFSALISLIALFSSLTENNQIDSKYNEFGYSSIY